MRRVVLACAAALLALPASAQTISQRGFVNTTLTSYPQDAPNDRVNEVGDLLVREEVFVKPISWLQFAAGADIRANTHGQVNARVDWDDRDLKRPALAIRELSATLNRGAFTLDVGKQFIRWGTSDIVTPTDWLAPRDFLNVIDTEYLPVTGVRGSVRAGAENFDVVWLPVFTPSRIPLLDQRWAVPPAGVPPTLIQAPADVPDGSQVAVRWNHAGSSVEYALAFFNGFNNLPNFAALPGPTPDQAIILTTYPPLRSYGGDVAVPTRWLTMKAEAAYFTSVCGMTDEYVLYVVQLERQTGEWSFVGGYAGDAVTRHQAFASFAPDRGLTKALVGRASYTIDVNRSIAFETAIRQNGDGGYAKAEYSQARGDHWRATISAALLRGDPTDFIGQYRLNSHVTLSLRYSF